AVALGQIGSSEARAALFAALADARQGIRWRAAEALNLIGLDPGHDLGSLVTALGNRDLYVRAFAAWSLGQMGPAAGEAAGAQAALPALQAARRDPNDAVREAAAGAATRVATSGHGH